MDIRHFYNLHKGETCLLVGNGPNLEKTPPELFNVPQIGMNTIHKRAGYVPDYYVAVDSRMMREFPEVAEVYRDVPKFIPTPNLDKWQGENFYRFYHRPDFLYPRSNVPLKHDGLLTEEGITYANVMHVAMQIAFYMGFTTLLMVGVYHGPHGKLHFWGADEGVCTDTPPLDEWFAAYKLLADGMKQAGVRVLNISEDTHVPDDVLPRDDWRNHVS